MLIIIVTTQVASFPSVPFFSVLSPVLNFYLLSLILSISILQCSYQPVTVVSSTFSRPMLLNLNLEIKSSRFTTYHQLLSWSLSNTYKLTVAARHASFACELRSAMQHSPVVKDCQMVSDASIACFHDLLSGTPGSSCVQYWLLASFRMRLNLLLRVSQIALQSASLHLTYPAASYHLSTSSPLASRPALSSLFHRTITRWPITGSCESTGKHVYG